MTTPQTDRRGVRALQAFQEADNLDAMTRTDHGDEVVYSLEARKARAKGEILLQPTEPVTVRAGEAATWENKDREIFKGSQGFIVETLEHPNSISSGASGDRMNAALGAGVLEPAIDAAMSAQARNSVEKMLCHQWRVRISQRCASSSRSPGTGFSRQTSRVSPMPPLG